MARFRISLPRPPSDIVARAGETAAERAAARIVAERRPAPAPAPAGNMMTIDQMNTVVALLSDVSESVEQIRRQQKQTLDELQYAAVELSVTAASWLTGVALEADQFAVDDLIRAAIGQLDADEVMRVRMNPMDHLLLKKLVSQSEQGAALLDQLAVTDDVGMARGSCRIESAARSLITDMESRLEEIRRTWMENLDVSTIERRGDGAHGRALRRFPDRRETA